MEQEEKEAYLLKSRIVFEFFGTLCFVYGIVTANGDDLSQAVVMGACIWISLQHSGSQYNPAVTINLALRQKLDLVNCLCLVITQVVAAFLGAMLAYGLMSELAKPSIDLEKISYIQAFFLELLGTFMLVTMINIQTTPASTLTEEKGLIGPLFIILFYTCRLYAYGSGGLLNPAIGIGIPLVAQLFTDYQFLDQCWVWIAGPMAGSVLAWLFFDYMYLPGLIKSKKAYI